MKTVYIVEVESGCTDHGTAMLFNSAWSTREAAEAYCKKFENMGYCNQGVEYSVTEYVLDSGD